MDKKYIMKIKASMIFLKHIWNESKLYFFMKIFEIFLGVAVNIFNVMAPKYFIDAITVQGSLEVLVQCIIIYIIIVIALVIIGNILSISQNYLLHKINISTTKDTINKLYKIPYSLFDDYKSYDIINRAFTYSTNSGTELLDTITQFLEQFFTILSFLYILGRQSPAVIVVIIICIIIQMILSKKQEVIDYKYNKDITITNRKIEHFKGIAFNKILAKEIKVNTIMYNILDIYTKNRSVLYKKFAKNKTKMYTLEMFIQMCNEIILIVAQISLGIRVLQGAMTIGNYTVVLNISHQFIDFVLNLINTSSKFYKIYLESENYIEFLEIMNKEKNGTINPFENTNNSTIIFKNVSFKYPNQNEYILKDFNLEIQSGKTLTILGDNGAGKSTIIKLILKLYTAEKGEILINNININDIDIYEYYKKIGVVFQDFELISGIKIFENITLFDKDKILGKDKVEKLMKEFKMSTQKFDIEKPYSKLFDSDGMELSGGEKQKFALMRAMLKDANLIILDESSSALDITSENVIFNNILNKINNKTIIFISHRLAIAKKSDYIIFMRDGVVIEEGTHNELIKFGKNYKELITLENNSEVKI